MIKLLEQYFGLNEWNSTIRVEAVAGVTTFMTMAYILIVNPNILSNAIFLSEPGDLNGELVIATALAAVVGTLCMGLFANFPFALAPGMGLNAFFAFTVVLKLGIPWRLALGAVLVEGVIFILLTASKIRTLIINAIPMSLKHSIAAGIGLFVAYIGLSSGKIIVANPVTKTALGSLNTPEPLIAVAGTVITAMLFTRGIPGALLLGILSTALIGWISGVTPWPSQLIGLPQWPEHLMGQAVVGLGELEMSQLGTFILVTFIFLFVDLFDTVGTLAGVGIQAGYLNEKGELPRSKAALMADAVGTTAGAIFGTSTVTTYIESATGVAVGGRTGLTAVIVALLFVVSLIFKPFFAAIPTFATVPALFMVGVLMMSSVRAISWSDPTEAIPAFATILLMPLTFSIAEGLAVGVMLYPVLKWVAGKSEETNAILWGLAALFALRFGLMIAGII
ncbi:NCS2 family permease [Candidatus Synechococcus calcipolaris G9]|uniref:NCS2 family permease n=1 Tax=Candidatus Synechococcus calcipolaris G9 TaxID=1497997 RepID=A0ABT6F1A4_9SYNE|nr:NCS2 family permease [Candidatus Synechococcus calcipolaris]MDG2991632.1 NCS2 family permease [Candidatus Synechococcus calcipolaris G9]